MGEDFKYAKNDQNYKFIELEVKAYSQKSFLIIAGRFFWLMK